jgi:hypothetical protein
VAKSLKNSIGFIVACIFFVGCQNENEPAELTTPSAAPSASTDDNSADADVAAAMAELSPEDRKEAEAQKFCAVMDTNLLGSMGVPLKLDVNGQAVFVCCAGCKSKALKNADATLATVARLKADNAGEAK